MIYSFIRRGCVFLALAAFAIFFFQGSLMAKELILNRTGTIKVTQPDGMVLLIEPNQALPDIPSGSKVEVLDGSIEIEPSEGSIQLVVGGSVATVKAGDNVAASFNQNTGAADFKVTTGQVNIVTGNTTTTVGTGQHAQVNLDKVTGITTVKSITGIIETVTAGVRAALPEGAIAKINVDSITGNVLINSVKGNINAVTAEGKIIEVKEGELIDTATEEGQIPPSEKKEAPLESVEEPSEPERLEGSEYN